MKKWITDIIQAEDAGATYKAKNDIANFAEEIGLRKLSIFRYDSAHERSEEIHSRIDGITAPVKRGDIVYYQFPTYNGVRFEQFFIEHMDVRGAKMVAIVHDIEFLRFPSNTKFDEIKYLNRFSVVIVHNKFMAEVLKNSGLNTSIISLDIFDYAVNDKILDREEITKQVIIAGSLDKSLYLKKWDYETPVIAYGLQPSFQLGPSVKYMGALAPESVAQNLPAGFGLAWDTNTNAYENSENYAKYNNPHKVSLYLASGLPVIVKKNTAIANIVVTYNLGIIIDSLEDLDTSLSQIDEKQMRSMLISVNNFRKLLSDGYYTKRAIAMAEFQVVMGFSDKEI
ncbi:hypothetical protein [Leuconostoc palmae]|uniref:hypothetical protein n=1 Tax=Leuconostoc palmae TaxID=501487 RepID=UPI001C7D7022|nr:hypothetical protein [Leuconostoc palmae]